MRGSQKVGSKLRLLTDDVLEIRIRQALEFYPERRWGLDQEFPRLELLSTDHVPMTEEEINAD